MAPAAVETPVLEQKPTAGDRIVDAASRAAHFSHEVRAIKTLAADAVEDGVYAAKRAMKSVQRRVNELGDLKDEAIHRVKRQPVPFLGAAFGVGLAVGVAVGWMAHRSGRRS